MAEKTAKEYADELMRMYNSARTDLPVDTAAPPSITIPETTTNEPLNIFEDSTGGLQVNVTTLRRLYPVQGATITVFTGPHENMTVIETDVSDESGKSGVFKLKTPARQLSQTAAAEGLPYAQYNLRVAADGFVEQINMNIPVFSGVVSVQSVDLSPIAAAGRNTGPKVIDEANDYNL